MSTVKQQSNLRVMYQKADKAQRLIEEIMHARELRSDHKLWDDVGRACREALIACDNLKARLEDVAQHNKRLEGQKI